MSDDLKHFREAVAKFEELKLELEDIKEGLESNFENYQNVSNVSSENVAKFQTVLENINTLQINAVNAVEKAFNKADSLGGKIDEKNKKLYNDIADEFDKLYSAIDEQIKELKTDTKSIVTEAMNNVEIDTADLSKIINSKIGKLDLSKVDNFITKTNSNIDQAIKQMAHSMTQVEQIDSILKSSISSLDQTANKINNATDSFNGINKSVTMSMTIAMLFIGIVIGFGVATWFKIDAISDNYFSSYEKKQTKLEADQEELKARLDKSHFLVKELLKGGYEMEIGKFTDTKQTYISIKKGSFAEKPYISKSGNAVTILR